MSHFGGSQLPARTGYGEEQTSWFVLLIGEEAARSCNEVNI